MRSKATISALAGMMVTSAFGAPARHAMPNSLAIEKRQATVQNYTCVMNAIATNGVPVKGGTIAPNTFISSTGINVGIAGATEPLWSSSTFDVWDFAHAQTIKASDTHLPMDVVYSNHGGIPTFSCGITYNGIQYDCDTSSDISILEFGSKSTQAGQVQFPCEMTPPSNTGGDFAPGWCTTHVVQYQKPDPAPDPYKLDVTAYDGAGTIAGDNLGSVSPTDVTGILPYTLVVSTGGVDADLVQFAHGDQTWDSTSTDHQCSQGSYDHGKRQIDCGWTCYGENDG